MGKPAARVGDAGSPPHAPSKLAPGMGSLNVQIGGKPAWRANEDDHICTTPIAPPAPAPHGLECCYLGSLSVMINGQMAVRQGDMLIGAGPPNPVLLGLPSVLIGDMGFGLADPANMAEFCAEFAKLVKDWENLSPEERRQELENMTNKQLTKSDVPSQSVQGSASHQAGNAQYDFASDTLEVSKSQLKSNAIDAPGAKKLANAVWHEARHAEQWNLMARHAAGQGQSAAKLAKLGITPNAVNAAAAKPLTDASAQSNLAQASYNSVYGKGAKGGAYRNGVIGDIDNRYDEYRALPEEQDAWNTGDSLPCG